MSLAIGRMPVQAVRRPAPSVREDAEQRLKIAVLFTSVESTLAALKGAGELASHLGAQITLVVPQVVPYPLPLQSPPVSPEFRARRFRVIASHSPVETKVQICLCRDPLAALKSALPLGSIVVLSGRKRWWPTKSEILARQIRLAGYEVIFKETE